MNLLLLVIGDLIVFYASLLLALAIRHGGLSFAIVNQHIIPFFVIFVLSVGVFYIAGLYNRSITQSAKSIFNILLMVVSVVMVITIVYFYLFSFGGISPKTILAIFFTLFFVLEFLWHYKAGAILRLTKRDAILIGESTALQGFDVLTTISPTIDSTKVIIKIIKSGSKRILFDFKDEEIRPLIYNLHQMALSGYSFIDTNLIKEDMNGYVNLSYVDELWLLKHMHRVNSALFLSIKRLFDFLISIMLAPIFIILLPFVAVIIKLQDCGDIFISQERVGLHGKTFLIYKFRTMTGSDTGRDAIKSKLKVTTFGSFLRKSRIDELPQILNILKGELSFIGPRPEITSLANEYNKKIKNYRARQIIRPGLTGWAQVTHKHDPHHGINVEATHEKLAYDLYYIKNLSLFLEVKIMIKTLRRLLVNNNH